MSNILITDKCNLQCPYCFAQSTMEQERHFNEISLLDFKKYLMWRKGSDNSIRILGGEPLLHKKYTKILKMSKAYGFENIVVFTNGILLDQVEEESLKYKNLNYCINVNSIENMGKSKYLRMKNNIINYKNKSQLALGLNLYKPDLDLTYFFDLLLESGVKRVRVGIAVIDESIARKTDMFEYYSSMKPIFIQLILFCQKYNISVAVDCNNIPICVYTEEELDLIDPNRTFKYFKTKCSSVCDVTIKGETSHCFIFTNKEVVNIYDFSNEDDLSKHIEEKYHCYIEKNIQRNDKCKKCEHFKTLCSGGCLSFYMEEIEKLL